MELTPSGSSASAAFTQQGAIDWTKLSGSTFSATLSILGRLSADGLEPLTVAVAQAMFLQIPIGSHGEQVLNKSIATLKSFSSFGQLVWFGVGVRHILHVLIQTSQGAASVALAACLAETHSPEISALVFYEMAKLMASPTELSPSFSQWERYVKVCSGIFADTHFGSRVSQLARLAGLSNQRDSPDGAITHPERLSEVLVTLGRIVAGQIESIDVIGRGVECCWVACYCDFLLGLRVKVTGKTGEVLYQNYDDTERQAQVFVHITPATTSALFRTRQTFIIEPIGFLDSWTTDGYSRYAAYLDRKHPVDQVLRNIFNHSEKLMDTTHPAHDYFAKILGMMSLVYSAYKLPNNRGFSTVEQFINETTSGLPELGSLKQAAIQHATFMHRDIDRVYAAMCDTPSYIPDYEGRDGPSLEEMKTLKTICDDRDASPFCEFDVVQWYWHKAFSEPTVNSLCFCPSSAPCKVSMKSCYLTPILLGYFLGRVIRDDDLCLSQKGILSFHQFIVNQLRANIRALKHILETFERLDMGHLEGGRIGHLETSPGLLPLILSLFSGREMTHDVPWQPGPAVSAISDNGFYAYFDILRDPDSPHLEASRIHIGRGSIRTNNRPFSYVRDQDKKRLQPRGATESDAMPENIQCRALVEEGVVLHLWFERWDADSHRAQGRDSLNPVASIVKGWAGNRGPWPGGRDYGDELLKSRRRAP